MENSKVKKKVFEPTTFPEITETMVKKISDYRQLMMVYHSAILEITTKLEILNDELSLYQKNPILFIKSRVKKPQSIANKLERLDMKIESESIVTALNDVAGIRVVCSFIDDVYKIATMLMQQDDIKTIQIKDYIKNPKPNGYRSYHLILEVPVYFSNKKQE
jgi:putative GTP pyrophosphokinase